MRAIRASTVGFAWAANSGEIEVAKLAETKATNADVKAFAKMLVTDHTKMLKDVNALASKNGLTPDTTMDDVKDLMGHSRDELKDLTEKAKGADWDKDFIDKMVDDHQKVLDKLQDAAKNTTDSTMTKALTEASGKVQEHLTKQIADCLCHILKTEDVAVYIQAKHYCVISRGVEDINSETITTDLRGAFKNNSNTRNEFLAAARS